MKIIKRHFHTMAWCGMEVVCQAAKKRGFQKMMNRMSLFGAWSIGIGNNGYEVAPRSGPEAAFFQRNKEAPESVHRYVTFLRVLTSCGVFCIHDLMPTRFSCIRQKFGKAGITYVDLQDFFRDSSLPITKFKSLTSRPFQTKPVAASARHSQQELGCALKRGSGL